MSPARLLAALALSALPVAAIAGDRLAKSTSSSATSKAPTTKAKTTDRALLRGSGWRLGGFVAAPLDGLLASAEVNGVATGVALFDTQAWLPRWDGEVAALLLSHDEDSPDRWTADVDSVIDAVWANDYGRPTRATWTYDSETDHRIDVASTNAECGTFCSDDHRVAADSCNGTWIEDGTETCSNGYGTPEPTTVALTVATPLTFSLSGSMTLTGELRETGDGVFGLSHGATGQAYVVDAAGVPVTDRDGHAVSLDFEESLAWDNADGVDSAATKDRHLFDLDPGTYSLVIMVDELASGSASTTGADGAQEQTLSYWGALDVKVTLTAVGAP